MEKIIVGLTGASGGIYFLRLMEQLAGRGLTLHVIATAHGEQVLQYETGVRLGDQIGQWNAAGERIVLEDNGNLFSSVASGSYRCDAMVVLPCSMSTAGELAGGITKTLLTRAADVMLKEQRKLLLVPRETPLSSIHLKNLYTLSKAGATILPAMPGFYSHPATMLELVDFVVGKALDNLGLASNCYKRWEGYKNDENKN